MLTVLELGICPLIFSVLHCVAGLWEFRVWNYEKSELLRNLTFQECLVKLGKEAKCFESSLPGGSG